MKQVRDETRDALVINKTPMKERVSGVIRSTGSWFWGVLLGARDACRAVARDHYALCALVVTVMIAGMFSYGASETTGTLICFTVLFICVAVWKSPSTSERIHRALVCIEDREKHKK